MEKEEVVETSKTTTMDSTTPTPPAPKLTFFTLPAAKRPETPWMATPPLKLPGSIPFMWEEAPGKPKREPRLPPSMLSAPGQTPVANHITSPTTVLTGTSPKNARVLKLDSSNNFKRNEEQLEVRDREGMILKNGNRRLSMSSYSSSSWFQSFSSSSSSSSSPSCYCDDGGECGKRNEKEKREISKVTSVTRVRRTKSYGSLSLHASSHLWTRIYEGVKHATRCRRSHKRS